MGTDYSGNTNKGKETKGKPRSDEKLEKVVSGEVVVHKKKLGQKIKDLFVEADFRTVFRYIAMDVLVPSARNMIVDAATKGVEKLMYGDRSPQQRFGPRSTYNRPVVRSYDDSRGRVAPPISQDPRSSRSVKSDVDYVVTTRAEAETVVDTMRNVIEQYDVVSVGDLHDLLGLPTSHTDNKWGWVFLDDVRIQQVREGYLINFPPAEPLAN